MLRVRGNVLWGSLLLVKYDIVDSNRRVMVSRYSGLRKLWLIGFTRWGDCFFLLRFVQQAIASSSIGS